MLSTDNGTASSPPAVATAPAAETAAQGPPRGSQDAPYEIYIRTSLGAVYRLRVQTQFLVFFPDATAMGSLPNEGMDVFNAQAYIQKLAQRGPVNNLFGRYQVNGPRVDIMWGNFNQSLTLQTNADAGAVVSGGVLRPACRCDGVRFSGIYAWGQYTLLFSADGTFADRGAIDVLAGLVQHFLFELRRRPADADKLRGSRGS